MKQLLSNSNVISLVFIGFFSLLSVQEIFSQRIFQGEIVTVENDTLQGEVWFGLSGEMPVQTRLVYFSEDGEKIERYRASVLTSMTLVHDINGKERHYTRIKDYLFSEERKKDYENIGNKNQMAGAITSSGDTILGKYVKFSNKKVPVKGVGKRMPEIISYWYEDKGKKHVFKKMNLSDGTSKFLEPLIEGELSLYREVKHTSQSMNMGPDFPSMPTWNRQEINYLCKDDLGCKRVQSIGFKKLKKEYTGNCDLLNFKIKHLELLVETYNEQCGRDHNPKE